MHLIVFEWALKSACLTVANHLNACFNQKNTRALNACQTPLNQYNASIMYVEVRYYALGFDFTPLKYISEAFIR